VTCHRLMRCSLSHLADVTAQVYPDALFGVPTAMPRWFTLERASPGVTRSWHEGGPVGTWLCCLEVERGTCGALVHLTVTSGRRGSRGGSRVLRSLLDIWAATGLALLAWLAEADVFGGDRRGVA